MNRMPLVSGRVLGALQRGGLPELCRKKIQQHTVHYCIRYRISESECFACPLWRFRALTTSKETTHQSIFFLNHLASLRWSVHSIAVTTGMPSFRNGHLGSSSMGHLQNLRWWHCLFGMRNCYFPCVSAYKNLRFAMPCSGLRNQVSGPTAEAPWPPIINSLILSDHWVTNCLCLNMLRRLGHMFFKILYRCNFQTASVLEINPNHAKSIKIHLKLKVHFETWKSAGNAVVFPFCSNLVPSSFGSATTY